MAVTFKWSVDKLECFPEHNDNFMAVHKVYWNCTAFLDHLTCKVSGIVELPDSNSNRFIEYRDLTEELIFSWCWVSDATASTTPDVNKWKGVVDKANVELKLVELIQEKKKPITMFPTLPWNNSKTN